MGVADSLVIWVLGKRRRAIAGFDYHSFAFQHGQHGQGRARDGERYDDFLVGCWLRATTGKVATMGITTTVPSLAAPGSTTTLPIDNGTPSERHSNVRAWTLR